MAEAAEYFNQEHSKLDHRLKSVKQAAAIKLAKLYAPERDTPDADVLIQPASIPAQRQLIALQLKASIADIEQQQFALTDRKSVV